MIPNTLQIKNFLSYGPALTTVDFKNYDLICLSGKNGHGKSALLDAMTWAVWGQARKIGGVPKPDSNLLRLGQTQMMVIFDFTFNGQQYRIKREYAHTYGKPYAALDFGMLDAETGTLKALTDKTIRDTQAKIESMLGLDYESFINSAFLRQGQANEFSKKSAKERKDVLATILNLHQYEALRKRALEKARDLLSQQDYIAKNAETIRAKLAESTTTHQRLQEINEQITTISTQETQLHAQENQLLQERAQFIEHEHTAHRLQEQSAQITTKAEELRSTVRNVLVAWRTYNRTMRTLHNKAAYEEEHRVLTQRIAAHQQAWHRCLETKAQLLSKKEEQQTYARSLQDTYVTHIHRHELECERLNIEVINTIAKINELTTQQQVEQKKLATAQEEYAQVHTASLVAPADDLAAQEIIFEKRKQYYHQWVARATVIKQLLQELTRKAALIADQHNPSCPLCEQNLSAARKRFLVSGFTEEEKVLAARLARLARLVPQLKQVLTQQHAHMQLLKDTQEKQQAAHHKALELQKNVETHKEHIKIISDQIQQLHTTIGTTEIALQEKQIALAQLQQQQHHLLVNDVTYQTMTQAIVALEHILNTTVYDAEQHQRDREQMTIIESMLLKYAQAPQEQIAQAQRRVQIKDICTALKQLKQIQQESDAALTALKQQLAQKPLFLKKEQELQQAIAAVKQQKEHILQEKGSVEHQVTHLATLEKELLTLSKNSKELGQQAYEYQQAAQALGKDGIQALLIEDALPEIEQEANTLLGQLTDNQAHIFIESLRDLKKGGTKETLDIKISDSMGVRPYELFSGGEAFRIDFALRIAISKLLARRAGTSLQTLIIDEGFGSQDDEGLTHMMDCIHRIQDSFCKIIIVSHLPAMKSQFPVHFHVEKGPHGSTVNVIEQG